ncbi:hypothetical protein ACFV0O_02660 [Kitasatospora sp. NPDC059577]|uniref:hypothetical protein n=1 Tax=Kitasatospora sp. NPDC059577 TaxID=3346873 RepID=UPI0036B61344
MDGQELAAAAVEVLIGSSAHAGPPGAPGDGLIRLLRERLGRTTIGTAVLHRLDTEGGGGGAADIARSVLADEIARDPAFGHQVHTALGARGPVPPAVPTGPPPQLTPPPPSYAPTHAAPYPPAAPYPTPAGPAAPAGPPQSRPRPTRARTLAVWLLGLPQYLLLYVAASLGESLLPSGLPAAVSVLIVLASLGLLAAGTVLGVTALLRSSSPMLIVGTVIVLLLLLDVLWIRVHQLTG